jgi:plasmid replication initiation protein
MTIKAIQERMGANMDSTLFGDPIIRIPIKEVVQGENYLHLKKACASLREKTYEIARPDGGWLLTGFANTIEYLPKEGILEFEFSKKVIPFLIDIAKGFTLYNLGVALSIKSPYTQRFYEFCSQFKKTGIWRISIKDLKERLALDNSPAYNGKTGNGNLKARILDHSKKELKRLFDRNECDLYFTYVMKKTGREFTDIEFKIVSSHHTKAQTDTSTDMEYINIFLRYVLPSEDDKAYNERVMKELFNKGHFHKAAERFKQLDSQVSTGAKKQSDLPKLLKFILRKDYGIY